MFTFLIIILVIIPVFSIIFTFLKWLLEGGFLILICLAIIAILVIALAHSG